MTGRSLVEKKGLGSLVAKLRGKGFGSRKICDEIKRLTGVSVSHVAVSTYLSKVENVKTHLDIVEKEEVKSVVKRLNDQETIFEELLKLKDEAWNYLDFVKKSMGDKPTPEFIKVLNHLLDQLNLIARITGRFAEKKLQVQADTVNIIDFSTRANDHLQKLRRDGCFVCGDCGSKNIKTG